MPYTAAHGPSWYDAIQTWDPPLAAAPPALNNVNTSPPVWPRTRLDAITGWRDLPDMTDNRDPRTFGIGDALYPPRFAGKTLVYEGAIEAMDRLDFAALQHAMVTGYGDRDTEGVMTLTPWASPGGVVWTFSALVLALTFEKAPILSGNGVIYEWPFVLTLRMSDPHFYTGGIGYL